MALAGVKLDDGRGGFASNCFPVRSAFGRTSDDASGAWLIAQHAEQRRRFKAVLCAKPRTYSRIKEERKKSELQGTKLESHKFDDDAEDVDEVEDDGKVLDGFFLMKHCCIDDPADLCSVNIASKELTDVKEDDLMLFENVAYVNAGENYLPFEAFRGFPSLRELEIPLNGLRNLKISHTDFTNLEMLDLSYNNLSQEDLLTLGLLTRLKVLHLTGNNFKNLPQDLAMPYLSREKQIRLQRFSCLEVLLLDDNKLMDMTVFAALAGLPKLRHLNMAKNEIFFVPQLKSVEGRVVTQDGKEKKRPQRPGSSRKSSRRSKSRLAQQEASLIDLETERNLAREGTAELKVNGAQPTTAEEKQEESAEVTDTKTSDDAALQGQKSELMVDDFNTGDLSARIRELDTEGDLSGEPPQIDTSGPKLPPFPELRYLNLSDNKICEEESLLAVAAWPMLVELDIYNNPLTTDNSGDPPLLKRFLQDRLGIKINRMKPPEVAGHMKKGAKVEIRPRKKHITDVVPKVPKLSLEEKMMLELPPPPVPKAIEHGSSPILRETRKLDVHGNKKSVLPPIPTTPKEEFTQAWAEKISEEDEEEAEDYDEEEIEERRRAGMDREPSDTFFMTQLDDVGERRERAARKEISFAKDLGSKTTTASSGEEMMEVQPKLDDRYKGYELLLDIEDLDDEPELPPSRDVQSNIRALKHTLNHMLVYRDPAVELSKVKKMVPEFRRVPVPPAKPHQSYQEKVEDVLTKLKNRSTLVEEDLAAVLKDKGKFQRQYPDADRLLGQIQRRYNAVRTHSLKDAKHAKDITDNMLGILPAKSK